jgi:hypothetical protein
MFVLYIRFASAFLCVNRDVLIRHVLTVGCTNFLLSFCCCRQLSNGGWSDLMFINTHNVHSQACWHSQD